MRKIKFRAFHKKYKLMSPNIWTPENPGTFLFTPKNPTSGDIGDHKGIEMRNLILMQFIGNKDVKNKEIYEGDLMTLKDKENKNIGVVYFDVEWSAFKLKTHISTYFMHEANEVIGNIYENPELLR